jgi:hemerythrin-like domain-containing protein
LNDPVALLKKDHRDASAMLTALAGSKPGARRRSTVEKLVGALELHMHIEEGDVYPLVAELVSEEEAEEATVEHRLVRDGLANLQKLVDEPGFGAALAMLTAGIKHHVKEEEQEIFPELKRRLDRQQLSTLGDEIVDAKAVARRKTRNAPSRAT